MANVLATHSVGQSLANFLKNAYAAQQVIAQPFDFRSISSGELANSAEPRSTLTLFLYRISQNAELRNPRTLGNRSNVPPPLALDLHYLLTAWADDALMEQSVLSWAMREIQLHPVLDTSTLSSEADWSPTDVVQLIPEELNNEEMSRMWDSLAPRYRLSVAYVARVVRIDTLR